MNQDRTRQPRYEVAWRARLRWRVRRGPLAPDLELIRAVAECTTLRHLGAEVDAHRYHVPAAGLWRGLLRVRLSGRRLMALGAELLE